MSSRPAEDTSPSSAAIQDRATDSPYIDATRLKELRRISGDDAGFLDRYVHASFADIDGALSELREELSADHISAARDALHKIDGTAANLGAQEIIARSKLLKDSIRQFGAAVPASAIADLVTNCAATKSAFAAILLDHNNKVPTNVLGT